MAVIREMSVRGVVGAIVARLKEGWWGRFDWRMDEK